MGPLFFLFLLDMDLLTYLYVTIMFYFFWPIQIIHFIYL